MGNVPPEDDGSPSGDKPRGRWRVVRLVALWSLAAFLAVFTVLQLLP